ncbi:MAG TPA: response regulator transcription factor [Pseudonocardiaceae bacterium]|nr:response regulator transcription factor [Pseudonocardiaceae bacterium]
MLVGDDPSMLAYTLTDRGFKVVPLATGVEVLRSVAACVPDIVVLDLRLPDLDGATVLRMLRGLTDVPVIIATGRSDERSIVDSFNAGADDYVIKPFSCQQLVARIEALLRRTKVADGERKSVVEVGSLLVDKAQRLVRLDGRALPFRRREFDLLAYLAFRRDTVVSRTQLMREVWHQRDGDIDRTIDVHVSWVRRKLGETAANPRYLHTVRGVGFKLTVPR